MLWKLVLAIASVVTSPFRGPVDPVDPDQPPSWVPSRYGPQNWEAAVKARAALQGVNDDILYAENAGIKNETFRWPGFPGAGTVPYILDKKVANDRKLVGLINDAIKQYHSNTCVRFVKRTNEKYYLKIIKSPGQCYSYIGKQDISMQPQPVSLDDGCDFIGTVVHELGHAIGLFHEHQRSDRDTYLNVYQNNIHPRKKHNFNKKDKDDEETFGLKYDYTSIMHYGEYAFSKRPVGGYNPLKTMEAKDGTPLKEPYERPGLNANDIALIRKLYECK